MAGVGEWQFRTDVEATAAAITADRASAPGARLFQRGIGVSGFLTVPR